MDDYYGFIEQLAKDKGITLGLYKEEQMKRRLTTFRNKNGFSTFSALLTAFQSSTHLYEAFLDHMTINVSEFFRNRPRWQVLETKILPQLLARQNRLEIWSAACSTGEEPYTAAIILSKFNPAPQFSLLATDVDKRALCFAKAGRYPERVLKELSSFERTAFFTKVGDEYLISDKFKKGLRFLQHDLLTHPFEPGFDLIICRNVLIYFTDVAKHTLYHRFSQALNPGGILFVGSTEQIFNPSCYGVKPVETFFYEKIT